MLAISFLQLIPQSIHISSPALSCVGIVVGALFMFGLDKFVPHTDPAGLDGEWGRPMRKTAIYLLVGIALHHFPEGMAIALGTVAGFKMSVSIAVAIAIHDIPEGICTSAPYYYVTGKRLKTFLISSSTAVPTIVGYIIAHLLYQNIPIKLVALIIAATAGLMIYISADELIPTSCRKDASLANHSSIFFLIGGILSVVLLLAISK